MDYRQQVEKKRDNSIGGMQSHGMDRSWAVAANLRVTKKDGTSGQSEVERQKLRHNAVKGNKIFVVAHNK